MNQQELNLILENHKKWLRDEDGGVLANLSCANLRGADLSDADLRGADLSCADLSDANLSCANLRDADLRVADLRVADLRGANLRGANLSDANLRDADLSSANLRYANLLGADLRGANLRGADLWSTTGNCRQIKTIQTDVWQIAYTVEVIQIGCQRHSTIDWFGFDDEKISSMDAQALEWWKKWRPILLLILEIHDLKEQAE